MDIMQTQYFLDIFEKEKKAENNAVPFVYGNTFTDCLKTHHIDTEREINGNKIQAHTIYGLWEKYLIAIGEVEEGKTITITTKGGKKKTMPVIKPLTMFTDVAEKHMERMYNWLTTEYTDRYKSITTTDEQAWIKAIIRFIVLRRIMENKYEMWITTGRGFVDPDISLRIAEIYRVKYALPEIARLINAAVPTRNLTEEEKRQLAHTLIDGIAKILRQDPAYQLPQLKKDRLALIVGGNAVNE